MLRLPSLGVYNASVRCLKIKRLNEKKVKRGGPNQKSELFIFLSFLFFFGEDGFILPPQVSECHPLSSRRISQYD